MADGIRCPECGGQQVGVFASHNAGCSRQVAKIVTNATVPPQPTSVEEARRNLDDALAYLAIDDKYVDALIASVRADERAKFRAMVEGLAVCVGGYQRNPSAVKADILAALNALSSEGT